MELLEGETLQKWLARQRWPLEELHSLLSYAVRLGEGTIDMSIPSMCAAWFAASIVHFFAHSGAFLIDSAIKLPAAAPLTMLAVIRSGPVDRLSSGVTEVVKWTHFSKSRITDLSNEFSVPV